ncbi:MAG TPA: hypothetical protein VGD74_11460 [Vulgatibacter sp.]
MRRVVGWGPTLAGWRADLHCGHTITVRRVPLLGSVRTCRECAEGKR